MVSSSMPGSTLAVGTLHGGTGAGPSPRLEDDGAGGPGAVQLDQEEPLPLAQGQGTLEDGDGQRGLGGQRGAHVAPAVLALVGLDVLVAPLQVVVGPGRGGGREGVEQALQVLV